MKKRIKILLVFAGIILFVALVAAFIIWNKPHRDAQKETAINITAIELMKEFEINENTANKKYLDKVIAVKGIVTETSFNQDSAVTVSLKTNNAMKNIYCTLKKSEQSPTINSTIIIKGFCTGMLTDVVIIDAIIQK